jgi:hypothetical protein
VVLPTGRRLALGTDLQWNGGGITVDEIRTYWPDAQVAIDAFEECVPNVQTVWVAGSEFSPYRSFTLQLQCGIDGTMIDCR